MLGAWGIGADLIGCPRDAGALWRSWAVGLLIDYVHSLLRRLWGGRMQLEPRQFVASDVHTEMARPAEEGSSAEVCRSEGGIIMHYRRKSETWPD